MGNARGVITRVDVPLVWVDRGTGSEGGLGDVYLQALALPRLAPRWWTVLSAESRTDWQRDAATSVRSSVQLGFMFSPRIGTSLTVDVYSGDRPRPEYGVRAVLFRTRF